MKLLGGVCFIHLFFGLLESKRIMRFIIILTKVFGRNIKTKEEDDDDDERDNNNRGDVCASTNMPTTLCDREKTQY